jgi:DNA-binding Xre family transcriptional regulator
MEKTIQKKFSKRKRVKRQANYFFKGQNTAYNGAKLAKDLLERRERENIPFAQIAEETGIPATMVHRIETGENIAVNTLASICNWLGVPVQNYFK